MSAKPKSQAGPPPPAANPKPNARTASAACFDDVDASQSTKRARANNQQVVDNASHGADCNDECPDGRDARASKCRNAKLGPSSEELLERDKAIQAASRLLTQNKTNSASASDRHPIGVIATLPGAGKTAFCEIIHSKLAKQVYNDENFISLNVTFNSRMAFQSTECSLHPEHAVAWRMLADYMRLPGDLMNRFRLTLSGSFAVATTIHYIRQDFIRLKNLPSNTVVPVVVTLDEVSMLLGQTVNEKFDREFSTLPQWRQERRFIKWAIAPLRELSNSGGKVTLFMSGTRPFALSDAVQVDMSDKVTGSRFFAWLIEMPRLSGAASAQLATRRNNNAAWHRDVWKTLLLQRALGIPRQINNIFTTDNRSMPITIDPKSLIAFVRAIAFKSTLDDWADARIDRLVDLGLCFWTSLSQHSFSQQLMLNLHFLDLVKLDDDQCAYGHIASKLLTELQTIGKMSQPETVNDNAVSLPSHNWEQIVPRLLNLRLLVELCDACAKTKGAPQAADLTLPLPTLFEGAVLSDDLQSVMVVLRQFERAVDSIPDGFSLTRVNEEFSDLNASFVSVNGLDVRGRNGLLTVKGQVKLRTGVAPLSQANANQLISNQRSTPTLIAGLVTTQTMSKPVASGNLDDRSWLVSRNELGDFLCGLKPVFDALSSYNPNLSDVPALPNHFYNSKLTQAEARDLAQRFFDKRSADKTAYFDNHAKLHQFLKDIDPGLAAKLSPSDLTWYFDEQPPVTSPINPY
ncbi:hypothetical protein CAOG_010067 [Capsaspora owczarzaki ATCC 30864]|uniref:Uncharacterized protein n=2 Tax=Capsaspora owczarzaki (strain ATCC 30864) TaxID=595528 RepID=A0A0D2UPN6_CAPO3|nr:hypothetical protein CAOG_010067 [Capsaspora owczarzaki ATCC 30864]